MARRIYCGNQERIRSFSLVLIDIPFQHQSPTSPFLASLDQSNTVAWETNAIKN